MVLGFKQKFPWGEPTYFREKILAGVKRPSVAMYVFNGQGMEVIPYGGDVRPRTYKTFETSPDGFIQTSEITIHPKLTTIREGNRWKVGDKIHMAYGVRSKNYQQFNKGIPELETVKSVQEIKIDWEYEDSPYVFIDDRDEELTPDQVEKLAINDGFNCVEDFFRWFNKDFEGQILHWTDLKY